MTSPTNPPNPPDDPLDERLSAALDGDTSFPDLLDDAAARRRQELEAARDLLATPPPPLDDVTRRRLLRTAAAAAPGPTLHTTSRPRRTARRWRSVGVAAAIVAVLALAGWGIASLDLGSSGSANKASSKADSETTAAAPGRLLDLHEISDPSVLRRRVEAALNVTTTTTTPVGTTSGATTGTTSAAQPRCVSTVKVPVGDVAQLLATATFHGTPALVIVARDPSRTLVYVLATADCRLLTSQFLKQ